MKFEEILPKMRDEGMKALWNDYCFKFENGKFWVHSGSFRDRWTVTQLLEEAFTADDWRLEPANVVRWIWVFGFHNEVQRVPSTYMSEQDAEDYKVSNNFEWAEKIEMTRKEVEE